MNHKDTDQELQDLFENDPKAFADLTRTDEDARLYALLYATLPRLDAVVIPTGLSDRVLAQLEIKAAKTQKWNNYLLATVITIIVACGLIFSWVQSPEVAKSFNKISGYLPWSIAAALAFFGLEWLDQKMVWNKANSGIAD